MWLQALGAERGLYAHAVVYTLSFHPAESLKTTLHSCVSSTPQAGVNTLHRSSVFLLWPDHPLELSGLCARSQSLIDISTRQILSMFKVLQNVMAHFRSWRVGPGYSLMTPAITQTLHVILFHRPQAPRTHSSRDAPCNTQCFCTLTCM